MVPPILALAASLLLALALTPLAGWLARRIGALDHPLTARKGHRVPVPRIGGLAIAVAFVGGLVAAGVAGGPDPGDARIQAVLAAGAVIVLVGALDDLRGLSPRVKLVGQVAAALVAWAGGLRVEAIANPLGAPLALGALSLPFTVLFLVGAMNAMNLIDGLDGLASGVAATAAAAAAVVALRNGDPVLASAGASVVGACLGFLRHNLRPASIFMGDSGSLFLGLVLAASSIASPGSYAEGTDLLPPLVALGVPVIDTGMAMLRRAARGTPISWGDREHLHHRLLARGLSPRRVTAALVGVSALHAVFAVAIAGQGGGHGVSMLLAIALLDVALLREIGYLSPGLLARVASERRRYAAIRSAIRAAQSGLDGARSLDEVQAVLDGAAPAIGARHARLRLEAPAAPGGAGRLTRHGLRGERPGGGSLEFRWSARRVDRDRPSELGAEMLSARVGLAVRRLGTD